MHLHGHKEQSLCILLLRKAVRQLPMRQVKEMAFYNSNSREPLFSAPETTFLLHAYGKTFQLNQKNLISKSAKLAAILKEKQRNHQELSCSFADIPAEAKTFDLVVKFCNGFELDLTAENVIPIACIALYLEMTEDQCSNNLLKRTFSYFNKNVLPDWNESVKAIQTCESVLAQAMRLGLVDPCLNSMATKALADPLLLGKPIQSPTEEDDISLHRPAARRKLFANDCWFEDLTTLSLRIYEHVMHAMIKYNVPSEYVAGSLFRYAMKWAVEEVETGQFAYDRSPQREVIEAVQRLLPDKRGVLPCKFLFQLLRWANASHASFICRNGFEMMAGKQLNEAVAEDLLIPSHGYSSETHYDIDCIIRVFKIFFSHYNSPDTDSLIHILEQVDEYFAEVAKDINLKKETFVSLVEMSSSASNVVDRCSDGIYRAIDVYFDAHKHLTESEREELCQVLDCYKMSKAACIHAGQNERLPLRVVIQVLFVGQLRLREEVAYALLDSEQGSREEEKLVESGHGELENLDCRVMELEKECCRMKTEIEKAGADVGIGGKRKSLWHGMKRKFGCKSSFHYCNCHVKKANPRNGV